MDWESQDDGFIAKLLVEDGAKDISVGEPVLVFVEDEVHPSLLGTGQPRVYRASACHAALATCCVLPRTLMCRDS